MGVVTNHWEGEGGGYKNGREGGWGASEVLPPWNEGGGFFFSLAEGGGGEHKRFWDGIYMVTRRFSHTGGGGGGGAKLSKSAFPKLDIIFQQDVQSSRAT